MNKQKKKSKIVVCKSFIVIQFANKKALLCIFFFRWCWCCCFARSLFPIIQRLRITTTVISLQEKKLFNFITVEFTIIMTFHATFRQSDFYSKKKITIQRSTFSVFIEM